MFRLFNQSDVIYFLYIEMIFLDKMQNFLQKNAISIEIWTDKQTETLT